MAVLSNPRHEQFAQEYAKTGNATASYISVGYSASGAKVSASRLLTNANVRARIKELSETIAEATIKRTAGERSARVAVLDDTFARLLRVIEARSQDKSMASVPGGKTGLLVRTVKSVGHGPRSTIVEEYSVDVATLRELRETAKQAAIELGQWLEQQETPSTEKSAADVLRERRAKELAREASLPN